MFELSVLISLIVTLLVFFFTLYITLKKELDDLKSDSNKNLNTKKIQTRERAIKFLKIVTLFLIFFVVILYYLPSIIDIISNNEFKLDFELINFSAFGDFLLKLLPFKKGFFSDTNFAISYITGIVFSIVSLIIWYRLLKKIINPVLTSEYICQIGILILLSFGLIWANYFISSFLNYCIINFFILLSIVLNLVIYLLICAIISFIIYCFDN